MKEDYLILWNINFNCINCQQIIKCEDIYTFLDDNFSQIRKEYEDNIGNIINEDQYVEDPYEYPIYGITNYKCPKCNKHLEIQVVFSAYDKETCSFYDIKGTIPFIPFQVLKGEEIKEIILEFIFRWYHLMERIDIVTPYLDQYGYEFLGKLPKFIYYYNHKAIINIITRKGRNAIKKKDGKIIFGATGKVLLDRLFEAEKCETCMVNNSLISYGNCLACIKLSNRLKLIIPDIPHSHFHAKWYAGIKNKTVEILITSHNLTKVGKLQPETVGLIIVDSREYQERFLSKLNIIH